MVGSLTRSNMTLDLVGQRRRRRASGLTVAALSLGEGQSDSCFSSHRRVTLGWCRLKVRRGWRRYVGLSEDMFIRLINVVVKACDGPTFHNPTLRPSHCTAVQLELVVIGPGVLGNSEGGDPMGGATPTPPPRGEGPPPPTGGQHVK
jgi:hypothetical protein